MDRKTHEYRNMIADSYRKQIAEMQERRAIMDATPKVLPKNLFGQQLKIKSIQIREDGRADIQWEVDDDES